MSLKHRYWVQIEAECVTIRFYLLMKAKNVMNAKNNKFYFFCVLKPFSVCLLLLLAESL